MLAPKRILFVENGRGYGGAVICLRHLVRNLDHSRFQPLVITGRNGIHYREIASEVLWKHIPDWKIDVITIKRRLDNAHWSNFLPGLRFLLNQMLSRLDDMVNFIPFFLQMLITTWYFRPALIHVNNDPVSNRAAVLVGKIFCIPVISHVRGNPQISKMAEWLFRLPAYFISVSNWIAKRIDQMGVSERKIAVVYDGIELEKMDISANGAAFRKKYNIPTSTFAVGLVGMLIPWKGQRLFIKSGRLLIQEIPNLCLIIIGGTSPGCQSYEKELKNFAGEGDLKGKIIFTGHLTDLAAVYNGLDVVVSASTSPEPLGTMVIEGMTMGRPIVAPHHGGAVEMIEHERTGLLFQPNDATDLARCIKRCYLNPLMRDQLGQAARKKALATFSIQKHVKTIQAVYEKVLQDHKNFF